MNRSIEIDRFYEDNTFKDVFLLGEYQSDLLSTDSLNELKKISNLVFGIIEKNNLNGLLSECEYINLVSFSNRVKSCISSIIEDSNISVIRAIDMKYCIKYNYNDNFFVYLEKFQSEKNVNICIDIKSKSMMIYNLKGELIGEIGQSKYNDSYFVTNNHLYNVVEDKFKGKSWGYNMYKLYLELNKLDNTFILPEVDYTNVVSMIELYKKFGFRIVSKLLYGEELNIDRNDILLMEKIKQDYKNGYKEKKLDFSIKIEK